MTKRKTTYRGRFKGIKHLLEEKEVSVANLRRALINNEVPGKWETYTAPYDLVTGTIPKDTYVYVFLAEYFDVNIKDVLECYSNIESFKQKSIESINTEHEELY
tara:strand:- start:8052 stop:8363 length:312 start_codon:yes stop_codon:yes gene_type:complete